MKPIEEIDFDHPHYIVCEHLKDIKNMSTEEIRLKTHWFDAVTEDKKEHHRLIFCQPCAESWVANNMSNFQTEGTLQ